MSVVGSVIGRIMNALRRSVSGKASKPWLAASLVLFLTPRVTASFESAPWIPEEVESLAVAALHERWIPNASASPDIYRIDDGVEVRSAVLGPPFCRLTIRGEGLDRFLASTDNDPRRFAAVEEFCFPIVLRGGTAVGVLKVSRNSDEDGVPFLPGRGAFIYSGEILGGNSVRHVDALRSRYSTDIEVYFVRFIDAGLSRRFMIRQPDGTMLAGPSPDSLRSLEEEGRFVRENGRFFGQVLERVQDGRE
jgi:hypothetical protein